MLDEKGFKRMTYDEILTELENRAKSQFGQDLNVGRLSVMGILLRVIAWFIGLTWQLAEAVYLSAFISTATGVNIDRLAKLLGITRRQAAPAFGTVTITGLPNKLIEIGTKIRGPKEDDPIYQTVADLTLDGAGNGSVGIEALEAGVGSNVLANTLTELVEPDLDIYTVTNTEPIMNGVNTETDQELRERYEDSLSTGGASTLEALRASLLGVSGVQTVLIEENDTMTELNSIPPKSFSALVYGGSDQDVAEAIYSVKPAGIRSYGTTEVVVEDSIGGTHTIGFERAEVVPIYVNVTLSTNEFFPVDGMDKVQTNIIKYIGGIDADETVFNGLGLGDDVIYTRIISAAHAVQGIDDVTVELGTSENPVGTSNIAITNRQVALTDADKVVVS
ncbi:baseplate J/gp47 family protein [Exiguobacterium aestuarii]|uniref:baseplate J/gp47 family protein n=1 Tax=Exiguobacterium aestuarii TaxID=273527 RepID=UPI001CD6BD42|nr:baseplate J/gp47 family protein [Exiguobacterium aestuarii]MCA0980247.1 baseplate J/gp47 family protein [Exiguobacterium aestuarii]